MAQGKLKVKTKLLTSAKSKVTKKNKGLAIQRRGNAPVQPRKTKGVQKLKKMLSKTVNKAMEDELREKALEGKMSLINKKTDKGTSSKI